MSELPIQNQSVVEFIQACKEINSSLSSCSMDNSFAIEEIEKKVDLFVDILKDYQEKVYSNKDIPMASKKLLLAFENECTNLNNTLVIKFQTSKSKESMYRVFIKIKYTNAVCLSIFSTLCKQHDLNYTDETLKYVISFIKTCLVFITKDVFDDSLKELLIKTKLLSEKLCDHCSESIKVELLYSLYQLSLCQYDFGLAKKYKEIILDIQVIYQPSKILETMTTVYNICLKSIKNDLMQKDELIYQELINTAIEDIDYSANNLLQEEIHLLDDLKKLKYSLLLLQAEIYVKTENFEAAKKTVADLVARYGLNKSIVLMKVTLLKNLYPNNIETITKQYSDTFKEYITTLLLEKDFESLNAATEIFCDFAEYSSQESIKLSLYLLKTGVVIIPVNIREKLYGNLVFMLTNKFKESFESKYSLSKTIFGLLPQLFGYGLSESCANSIVVLIWNCAEPLIKKTQFKEAKIWLEYLTIHQIKTSLNNQTYGLILRKLQICNLYTNNFEKLYLIFEREMNHEIQNDVKTQVILFKALCNEIETLDSGSVTFNHLFNTTFIKCKNILSMLQNSIMTTAEFYDTIYTCFVDIKSSNPILIELLTYLLLETDNPENVHTLEDLSNNFSYIRVLIIAIQLYSNQINTDVNIKNQLYSLFEILNKLLNKSYTYLMNFRDMKKTESVKGSFGFNETCWLAAVSFNLGNLYYKNDIYLREMNFTDLSSGFINMVLADDNYTSKGILYELTQRKARNACLKVFYKTDGCCFDKNDFEKTIGELNGLIDVMGNGDAGNEKCVCEMQLAKLMLYHYFKNETVCDMLNDLKVVKLIKNDEYFMNGCFYVLLSKKEIDQQASKFSRNAIMLLLNHCMIKIDLKKLLSISRDIISWLYENDQSEKIIDYMKQILISVDSKMNDSLKKELEEDLDWFSTHSWNMSVNSLMNENSENSGFLSEQWFHLCIKFCKYLKSEKTASFVKLREQILM